jgi:thymidine kinase
VVLIVYAGWGLIDIARVPEGVHLGLYLVMTVFALLALRVVLQAALLREEHEPGSGAPLLCANCDQVVPDMAFCATCGVATNASSRSSRTTRRLNDNHVFIPGQWPPGSLDGG